MHTVVVQNKAYDVTFRVFLIKFFQELYKVRAFMAVTHMGYRLSGQQVYRGKEGYRSEPFVFAVPHYNAILFRRGQVGSDSRDGLYAGFLVI